MPSPSQRHPASTDPCLRDQGREAEPDKQVLASVSAITLMLSEVHRLHMRRETEKVGDGELVATKAQQQVYGAQKAGFC